MDTRVSILEALQEQSSMNKDQVKGGAKDIAGKVQEAAGKLVGSKEQQAKGLAKQVEGNGKKVLATSSNRLRIPTNASP